MIRACAEGPGICTQYPQCEARLGAHGSEPFTSMPQEEIGLGSLTVLGSSCGQKGGDEGRERAYQLGLKWVLV